MNFLISTITISKSSSKSPANQTGKHLHLDRESDAEGCSSWGSVERCPTSEANGHYTVEKSSAGNSICQKTNLKIMRQNQSVDFEDKSLIVHGFVFENLNIA